MDLKRIAKGLREIAAGLEAGAETSGPTSIIADLGFPKPEEQPPLKVVPTDPIPIAAVVQPAQASPVADTLQAAEHVQPAPTLPAKPAEGKPSSADAVPTEADMQKHFALFAGTRRADAIAIIKAINPDAKKWSELTLEQKIAADVKVRAEFAK